jgi:hypothetical protein
LKPSKCRVLFRCEIDPERTHDYKTFSGRCPFTKATVHFYSDLPDIVFRTRGGEYCGLTRDEVEKTRRRGQALFPKKLALTPKYYTSPKQATTLIRSRKNFSTTKTSNQMPLGPLGSKMISTGVEPATLACQYWDISTTL